mmetsp:Transcript_38622/g.95790  ORF Transcript_38622/g.95790 Transcript_38622/m.95790 type:complete len:236 (+) Transcript_38622:190-897(+)
MATTDRPSTHSCSSSWVCAVRCSCCRPSLERACCSTVRLVRISSAVSWLLFATFSMRACTAWHVLMAGWLALVMKLAMPGRPRMRSMWWALTRSSTILLYAPLAAKRSCELADSFSATAASRHSRSSSSRCWSGPPGGGPGPATVPPLPLPLRSSGRSVRMWSMMSCSSAFMASTRRLSCCAKGRPMSASMRYLSRSIMRCTALPAAVRLNVRRSSGWWCTMMRLKPSSCVRQSE